MKKIIVLLMVFLAVQIVGEARDYTKLQLKEMKKAQKHSASKQYFNSYAPETSIVTNLNIKDPKLITLGGYEEVSKADYKSKMAKDNKAYDDIAKFLASRKIDYYNSQAYGEDFYKLYRVAERIIRANNLDFINWRIIIDVDREFNASSSNMNCITINTGAFDTLRDNESALALLLGHEFAHSLLGHSDRKATQLKRIRRAIRMDSYLAYYIAKKRYNADSRTMEFAADVEGAKLAAKAGYDLSSAKETLSFLSTLPYDDELNMTHPDPAKRIKNYEDNRAFFMESEWQKQGRYNIYKSDVLDCQKSSDRKSIIISRGKKLKNSEDYYQPETIAQVLLRYGYNKYTQGDFKGAIDDLKKYLKIDKSDYAVYLYISYANEYLYKETGKESFLEEAKEFANYANIVAPTNKYVKEQMTLLQTSAL